MNKKSLCNLFVIVLSGLLLLSCTRETLITTSDGFKYYEVSRGKKVGVNDLNGKEIVPLTKSEIQYTYNSGAKKAGLNPNEFRRFLCKSKGDAHYTESYKINGTCDISHDRGYYSIRLDSYAKKHHFHLIYKTVSKDGLVGVCDSDGKELVFPSLDDEGFRCAIVEEKVSKNSNIFCQNIVFQDESVAYDSQGNCIVLPSEQYLSIGPVRFKHPDDDIDNYVFFCRRNDMGTDILSPKGMLICSSNGSAYLCKYCDNSKLYYYIVCGSEWDTIGKFYSYYYDYYSYATNPSNRARVSYDEWLYFQNYDSNRWDDIRKEQEYSIYDIYGNYICSIVGAFDFHSINRNLKKGRTYPNGCKVNYDEKKGFYKEFANYDDDNYYWSFENGECVYIDKWLDENLRVTSVNPNPSYYDSWNNGFGLSYGGMFDTSNSYSEYEWMDLPGSNDGGGNGTTPHPKQKRTCGLCGGSGEVVDIDGISFGGTKYCDKCKKTVPDNHYHKPCPSCKGKGWYY